MALNAKQKKELFRNTAKLTELALSSNIEYLATNIEGDCGRTCKQMIKVAKAILALAAAAK